VPNLLLPLVQRLRALLALIVGSQQIGDESIARATFAAALRAREGGLAKEPGTGRWWAALLTERAKVDAATVSRVMAEHPDWPLD
jgi:hypothetical protein